MGERPSSLWWITRARPGAELTAARLQALDRNGLVAPVLMIVPAPEADLNPAGFAALAFTSATGVSAFAAARPERDLPVFTVGAATAEAATMAGFSHVEAAEGDVVALSRLVIARALTPILHISGEDQAGDLIATVRAAGLSGKRRIAYRAHAAERLDPNALEAIAQGQIAGVLFHSPRGAKVFSTLFPAALQDALVTLTAACLSPAVAAQAKSLPWGRIAVAATPDEKAILALT